jgi:hypothetical protein
MVTGSFPGVRCGRGVTITPHPLLVPRSKIEYSYNSTLPKGLRGLWKWYISDQDCDLLLAEYFSLPTCTRSAPVCSICPAHWVLQQMKIQSEKWNVAVTAIRTLDTLMAGPLACYIHQNCPNVLNDVSVVTDANAKKQLEKLKLHIRDSNRCMKTCFRYLYKFKKNEIHLYESNCITF